jgi:hypothetical protein
MQATTEAADQEEDVESHSHSEDEEDGEDESSAASAEKASEQDIYLLEQKVRSRVARKERLPDFLQRLTIIRRSSTRMCST